MQDPKLCNSCQNIGFYRGSQRDSGGEYYWKFLNHCPLHDNTDALQDSAIQGCQLCCLIVDSRVINEFYNTGDHIAEHASADVCYQIANRGSRNDADTLPKTGFDDWHVYVYVDYARLWSTNLAIYAEEGTWPATSGFISGRIPQASSDSEKCFSMAKSWIEECLSQHTDTCPGDDDIFNDTHWKQLPTRVVDVGDSQSAPFLLVTNGMKGQWVSLSHCWGKGSKFVTGKESLEERQRSIIMEDLPKTFYDAIIATRHLGYQYLWIDSLCVLQDSKEDWAVEAGKMQDYYSKATLTIVADAAEGDHDGFLHSRPELKTIRVPFRHPSLPSTSYVYIGRRPTDLDGEKTPVRTRAWTLQEDVLSARTLHYTSDQLIFECRKHRRSEADSKAHILNLHVLSKSSFWGPKFIPRGMESGCLRQMLIAKDLSAWYPLLEIYCQRSLTVKDDRIAAISGLAKVVEEESGLFYKAGIFIDDVSQGLLWTLRGRGSRPAKYRAPTWTWTSLDFQLSSFSVRHSFGLYNRLERSAPMPCDMEPSIVECEIKTGHDVQNGRILSGYLRLHGFLLPYSRWQGKSPPYRNTVWSEPKGHLLGTNAGGIENDADAPDQLICDFDVIESAGRTEERILRYTENGRPVEDSDEDGDWDRGILDNLSLFQITRRRVWTSHFDVVFALLLRPAEGHQDGMTFERVGVAEFRHDIPELSRNRWEKKVITVI